MGPERKPGSYNVAAVVLVAAKGRSFENISFPHGCKGGHSSRPCRLIVYFVLFATHARAPTGGAPTGSRRQLQHSKDSNGTNLRLAFRRGGTCAPPFPLTMTPYL